MLNYKNCFTIIILCISSVLSFGQSRFSITAGPSLSFSNFKWSIAGDINGRNPTVLSDLTYTKIQRIGFFIAANYEIKDLFEINATIDKSYTTKGKGTDIDYQGNYKTQPTYRLDFDSKTGNALNGRLSFVVKARDYGFAKIHVGIQTEIFNQTLAIESPEIVALASKYTTKTYGIGPTINMQINLTKRVQIEVSETFTSSIYRAKANWNLNPNLQSPLSFRQKANGFKINTGTAIFYTLSDKMKVHYTFNYLFEKINKGKDIAYLNTGLLSETMFNGAHQKMLKQTIGLQYNF